MFKFLKKKKAAPSVDKHIDKTTDKNSGQITAKAAAQADQQAEQHAEMDVEPPTRAEGVQAPVAPASASTTPASQSAFPSSVQADSLPENQPSTRPPTTDEALEHKLDKPRAGFGKKLKQLLSVRKKIDQDLLEDIETTLLMADVGATATLEIVDKVAKSVKRRQLDDPQAVMEALREHLQELARRVEKPLVIDTDKKPFVILVTGVNGVGKTTTIAKLARRFTEEGKTVMLAAGDTFRAAAVEQLKTWGEREGIPVVAQATGADSASVIFDAMSSAKAKGIDVLIADTAGRLHTQSNLMQELEKINRVMKKADPDAPHETLIVVDGGTGQNAIAQVREFNKAVNLTGIAVTKLDGTAKGGVLFNLAREFGLPVRFIGVGEKSSDLKPYQANEFVTALME